jgi:hypothetical protein
MEGNLASTLGTTNVMLGIMAAVSVLEALVLIGVAIGAFMAYRKVMMLIRDIEVHQIEPLRAKVDDILTDVKSVTARVSQQTERVDHAISDTMGRVDDPAEKVKTTVREKVYQATGVVRGIRAVIMSLLNSESSPKPPATAAGRL